MALWAVALSDRQNSDLAHAVADPERGPLAIAGGAIGRHGEKADHDAECGADSRNDSDRPFPNFFGEAAAIAAPARLRQGQTGSERSRSGSAKLSPGPWQ